MRISLPIVFGKISIQNKMIPKLFYIRELKHRTKLSNAHLLSHRFNLSSSTLGGEKFRSWKHIAHTQPCVQRSLWCEFLLLEAHRTIAPTAPHTLKSESGANSALPKKLFDPTLY